MNLSHNRFYIKVFTIAYLPRSYHINLWALKENNRCRPTIGWVVPVMRTDYNSTKMVLQWWAESSGPELAAPESPAWFRGRRVCRKEMVSRYVCTVVQRCSSCCPLYSTPPPWVGCNGPYCVHHTKYHIWCLFLFLFKQNVFIEGCIPMSWIFLCLLYCPPLKGFYCRPMQFLSSLCLF